MPLMDGVEATKRINEGFKRGKYPYVPIVALTAGQLKPGDERLYFEEVGFAEFITKPASKERFMQLLKKYEVIG